MFYDFATVFQLTTMHRSLIMALLFMLPLTRRKRFWGRFCAGAAVCLLLVPLLEAGAAFRRIWIGRAFQAEDRLHTILMIIPGQAIGIAVYILLLGLLFYFCCRVRVTGAVYGAICVYLAKDMVFSVITLAAPEMTMLLKDSAFWSEASRWLLYVLLYAAVYFTCARKLALEGDYPVRYKPFLLFVWVVSLFGHVMITYAKAVYDHYNTSFFTIAMLYDTLLIASILYTQVNHSREQAAAVAAEAEKQLRLSQEQQYKAFQHSTEILSHRLHDLKYLTAALQVEENSVRQKELLSDLEKQIAIYDSQMTTGNSALDTLLNDTWRRCADGNIHWTCLADGAALRFLEPVDLYIMLGNVLDNAIEAASAVEDAEKRYITLNIWEKGSMAFIRCENYCETAPSFQGGRPVSTKTEKGHGYGTRSIMDVCRQYRGECESGVSDQVFSLNIALPIPGGGEKDGAQ